MTESRGLSVGAAATGSLSAKGPRPWERSGVCCLLLIVFGVCARLPALQGELIWDDHPLVEANPMIRSPILIIEAFRHHLFPNAFSGHYRPVQTVSYIFDYYFWNLDTVGFHLSNIGWHVASGILLYFLLRRLFPALRGEAIGTADVTLPLGNNRVASVAPLVIAVVDCAPSPQRCDRLHRRACRQPRVCLCGGQLAALRTPLAG